MSEDVGPLTRWASSTEEQGGGRHRRAGMADAWLQRSAPAPQAAGALCCPPSCPALGCSKAAASTAFKPNPGYPRRTCVAVFHLPTQLTATAECASGPSAAAHSRSALIVISRPITAAKIRAQAGGRLRWAAWDCCVCTADQQQCGAQGSWAAGRAWQRVGGASRSLTNRACQVR